MSPLSPLSAMLKQPPFRCSLSEQVISPDFTARFLTRSARPGLQGPHFSEVENGQMRDDM
jgi:hypothetical protein